MADAKIAASKALYLSGSRIMNGKEMLLVDDDQALIGILSRAMMRHGFTVNCANSIATAKAEMRASTTFVILDLSLGQESGLELIPVLKGINPSVNILLFTGYASIATAVSAIKLGANNYLPKPASVDSVLAALGCDESRAALPVVHEPLTLDRLQWEQIQSILSQNNGNISATARLLKMHRRSLQRKLAKPPLTLQ